MNEKLKALIKKIILGTTAAGTAYAGGIQNIDYETKGDSNEGQTFKDDNVKKANHPAFIFKKPSVKNLMNYLTHRSHRSHSSHRSHYSSYTQPKTTEEKKSTDKVTPVEPSQKENNLIYEFGDRVLKRGMSGTDVVELQEILNKRGYELKVDGEFGESTETAVKDFQRKNDLYASGKADVVTIYHLTK